MRIFRSLSIVCAMAFAMCGFQFASAAETVAYRLCSLSAYDDLGYHASVDKLHAELAYNASAKTMLASTVNSDLVRDSNGFRQSSAADALPLQPNLS